MLPLQVHHTDSGVRFVVVGPRPDHPAPTLLHFATHAENTLTVQSPRIAQLMAEHGYLSVSLDLPNHGEHEAAKGHKDGLVGWRERIKAGDNFLPTFIASVSDVIDHLVQEGYSDPGQMTVVGTSRGGFLAMHAAVADPRLHRVIAFSPVTDLRALEEFEGMEGNALAIQIKAVHLADRLVDRKVWVCIGNQDHRVSTHDTMATTQAIADLAAAQDQVGQVWLHVIPSYGHNVPRPAYDMAKDWLRAGG